MNEPMSPEKWDKLKAKGVLKESETRGIKDWTKKYREGSDSKYGCLMYSGTLERLRHVTFSEFYGNGIVD